MSAWIDKRSTNAGGSHLEIQAAPLEAEPKPPDISSTGSAATPSSSRKFPLRRFGELFRNKLRSSGSYSIKTLNDSVATIAKDSKLPNGPTIADLEKTLPAPVKVIERSGAVSGSIPVQAVIEQKSSAPVTAAAVVVNEKQTVVRNGAGAGHYGGRGGGPVGTGVRSRKVATLNRTFQRKKVAKSSGDTTTFKIIRTADVEPGGQKRQSISSQDTTGEIESEVVVGKALGRDRVNSASHYSTEKSGSSGYYSTNIYFAGGGSVVDEHIYYEPVDRGRKNSSDVENKTSEVGSGVTKKEGILKNGGPIGDPKSGRTLEKYYYPAALESVPNELTVMRAKQLSNEKLTDIVEGPDGPIPRPIWPLDVDDSLADINLEAFRMRHSSQQNLIGFESLASSNSDNEIYSISKKTADEKTGKKSQYEEYLEFHNTRNILEQIKGKLNTLLDQRSDNQKANTNGSNEHTKPTPAEAELEEKIANLKSDLEGYLQSMNQKNENEIKRFCKGMSKDAKCLAVQNAVEQKNRSRSNSLHLENEYEVMESKKSNSSATLKPFYTAAPHRTLTSYPKEDPKSSNSQPSYFETVYVRDGFNVRQLNRTAPNPFAQEVRTAQMLHQQQQQRLQREHREMAYQRGYFGNEELRPGDGRRPSKVSIEVPQQQEGRESGGRPPGMIMISGNGGGHGTGIAAEMAAASAGNGGILVDGRLRHKPPEISGGNNLGKSGGDVSDFTLQRVILMESLGKSGKLFGDKEKMLLEYHLNKPSYWEMYYGANREEQQPHHTLIRKVKIGGKNAIAVSYLKRVASFQVSCRAHRYI
ncbi:conserved hypothetical protein [Culex quinquefasciatus]|uniref:Uncharacterized protein n=1 Tax=Culex quinquefasciatus TaxID=7176 RepID=B0W5M8_CULQU|nr:conserved hypothetical protein [Culex quinquefasciatus]|eukprot:XP_001844012.1 conserved hypothetical protein [Culex quinquefasciatus]